ncbi:MAG: WYL domain-containing protein [Bacilli bacterium]
METNINKESNKKTSILHILNVLYEYTDKDHYLTQQDIIDKVYELSSINLERKSVSNSLKLLISSGCDITRGARGGYALLNRSFSSSEVQYLTDALFSSKSISESTAMDLISKVSSCLSKYERQDYHYVFNTGNINRNNSNDLFHNINIINEAIKLGKKISFQYSTYDEYGKQVCSEDSRTFIYNAYYFINNLGKYYLLGNYDKYDELSNYRVEYIFNIKILEDNIKPITALNLKEKDFSISKYINDHIYIFSGAVIEAKLKVLNTQSIGYIYDWFGANASITNIDGVIYAYIRCDENALFYWVMQYGKGIEVLSPTSIRDRIKEYTAELTERYK